MAEYSIRLHNGTTYSQTESNLRTYYGTGVVIPRSLGHVLELTTAQRDTVAGLAIVAEVQEVLTGNYAPEYVRYSDPINFNAGFIKDNTSTFSDTNVTGIPDNVRGSQCANWGLLHCTNKNVSAKQDWGFQFDRSIDNPTYTYYVSDTASIFSQGEHVDVIITDDAVPHDHPEFGDGQGGTRFQQFDWNTLTSYVQNELGNSTGLLTGTYTYCDYADFTSISQDNDTSHGLHVASTAAGLWNGWAKKANVYSICLFDDSIPNQSVMDFDSVFFYLRAFHRTKAINPATGRKNPTIVNCSWGSQFSFSFGFGSVVEVELDGTVYNSSSPPTHGWNKESVNWETGVQITGWSSYQAARRGWVQDCVNDGLVIVAAAGNDNQMLVNEDDAEWNDYLKVGTIEIPIYRNQWEGAVTVGALSRNMNKNRATFSNFGKGIDVWAPGERILASVGFDLGNDWGEVDSFGTPTNNFVTTGWIDNKYGNGFFIGFQSGTSMASPQVCGAIACHASSTSGLRYTDEDARQFLDVTSQTNWTTSLTDSLYFDADFSEPNPGQTDNRAKYWNAPIFNIGVTNPNAPTEWTFVPNPSVNHPIFYQDINGDSAVNGGTFSIYESSVCQIFDPSFGNVDTTTPYFISSANSTDTANEYPTWGRNYFGSSPKFGAEARNNIGMATRQNPLGTDYYFQSEDNVAMTMKIEYVPLPANIINYRFANVATLRDGETRSLILENTRPTEGQVYQSKGTRSTVQRYPRTSPSFRQL